MASEISPGKKIATRFLVLTKTKEPIIEEHIRDVEPATVKRTLVGVERVWRAIESGVLLAVNPDAHDAAGLADLRWGVTVARRAGAEARHLINCGDIEGWLARS